MKCIDDLMTDRRPRRLCANQNGTLRGTLPRNQAEFIGLEKGAVIQFSVTSGETPVVIDEPALIIRPYPVGVHNE
jgi:hypothetical protein